MASAIESLDHAILPVPMQHDVSLNLRLFTLSAVDIRFAGTSMAVSDRSVRFGA